MGEQHPGWCASQDGACGTHLSMPVDTPATAGPYRVDSDGVTFPRVEVALAQNGDGTVALHLAVYDPTGPRWAAAMLTPDQWRALGEAADQVLARAEGAA